MIRLDRATIERNSLKTTTEGFLAGKAVVTRIGVFNYLNTDGSHRRELRLAEDIFDQKSLDTMKMIPVTNDHPPELVSSRNADQFSVGFTGEAVSTNDDTVIINFTITNQDAINDVRNGKRELSLGYELDLELTSGTTPEGVKFDAIQRNLRYNHLAVVTKGRAGREARIKLDSYGDYAVQINDDDKEITINKGKKMLVNINGVDHEMEENAGKAVLNAMAAADEATKKVKTDLATSKARGDAAIEKLHLADEAEKARVAKESFDALVTKTTPILGKDYKFDGKDVLEIQKAVILKGSPEIKLDEEEPAYIQARFDIAIENVVVNDKGVAKQKEEMVPKVQLDAAGNDVTGTYHRDGLEELVGTPEEKGEDARRRFDTIMCHGWKVPNLFTTPINTATAYKRIKENM